MNAAGLLAALLLLAAPGAAALAGAAALPVGDVPVGALPVGAVPVGDVPVGDVPVGDVPVEAAQAGAGNGGDHKTAADSLLFASGALRLLEAARAGEPPAAVALVRSRPAPPAGSIHLAAIVYHAPDDWRIWLNGQSFTPAARPLAVEILKVTAERVVLAWRPRPGAPSTRIELRPNQTYVVASGEVVEGAREQRF